ncbi:hypothetical protein EBZ80_04930 [bacterium]|nr:hypothetical protein [bacterium]
MKKHILVFRINKEAIDSQYNIPGLFRQNLKKTRIMDITEKEKPTYFSFLDESKRDHHCVISMRSYLDHETLPDTTSLHCFWCRHSFPYHPIGCPIEYVSPRVSKTYHSEITKDRYVLRENLSPTQLRRLQDNAKIDINHNSQYAVSANDFYLTDGLFCSFNCCLAYIRMNSQNPLYSNSEVMLKKIYHDVFGSESLPLVEAPSWRLLKNYGGHITIEEFRKTFYKVDYYDSNNIIFPKARSVGFLFEKQIKL